MSKIRKLCTVSMLIAVSVVLGAYLTVRIGGGIKITFKFVTVFMSAYLFGPIVGGLVGLLSDIIAFFLSPTASFLPQVSAIEFVYGFIFGIMFYKKDMSILKIVICAAIQMLIINLFGTSYVLKGFFGDKYSAAVLTRLPTAILNTGIQIVMLSVLSKNNALRKAAKKIGQF